MMLAKKVTTNLSSLIAFGIFAGCLSMANVASAASPLPVAPTDAGHPGSKQYSFGFQEKGLSCLGRNVQAFVPTSAAGSAEKFPVVVYGHGQALDVENYRATLEHMAKKGIVVLFPTYDTGFFDQDWTRMGRDYANMTDCALKQIGPVAAADQIVFSGHSKGAYVASVAAGLAVNENLAARAKVVVLFEAAGFDSATIGYIEPTTATTVIFSDADTTVKKNLSDSIFAEVKSQVKQFIFVKSYTTAQTTTALKADHMWPLTKGSFFGGGPESSLHYYGAWKWLVAAALDLKAGGRFVNPYLYGAEAADKGIAGFQDTITR